MCNIAISSSAGREELARIQRAQADGRQELCHRRLGGLVVASVEAVEPHAVDHRVVSPVATVGLPEAWLPTDGAAASVPAVGRVIPGEGSRHVAAAQGRMILWMTSR
jgi:hypothetical protein